MTRHNQVLRFRNASLRLDNLAGQPKADSICFFIPRHNQGASWDRPDVEVTVVRSSEHLEDARDRAEAQRRLDSVQVTARQSGNDIVISTVYPPRNLFLHPLSRRSDVENAYWIKPEAAGPTNRRAIYSVILSL